MNASLIIVLYDEIISNTGSTVASYTQIPYAGRIYLKDPIKEVPSHRKSDPTGSKEYDIFLSSLLSLLARLSAITKNHMISEIR